ncbi:A-kinase anchor protein 13-like isoform X5 [Anarrhichthys ocellatus]|uniref:A-kinase anchor protein 13-like isoform X5 n=1 Tax=Anarrhichthys ocellatus TaxID=433405 RepID=UPI0012EE93E8|nr:A-kinase anchor protein 13-like isoform X5 [Anarrhichthys ocellatus]
MKLNPQQAPLYGECVLTVQLDDEDVCCAEGEEDEEEEAEFYLLFTGSTQRHLTSTLRVSHVTLHAVCPAHDVCEQVSVTLCWARPGGPVGTHSQETFCFVQDLALDMAHFLLDNIAPQEALLLDDEQIPLKECERLDQSLALALKHLTLPHQRTGPGVDGQLAVTDAHSGTETHMDTSAEGSTLPDRRTAASQCQQLSSLLHLAASHGLRTVAAFLLQQPGAREALRRPNAQGLTAARQAESRGHRQLAELFTQYETFPSVHAEPKEQPHFYPGGRVFQHHANLGTYNLTFPALRQRRGGGAEIQGEVEELRRRIHLHREEKGKSDFAGTVAQTCDPVSPACGPQPCSNGLSAVTIETCSTTTEERGRPPSLEETSQGEDSAVVTHTSCTSGTHCQRQEAGGEQKGTPAANSPAGRSRKNRKRTTKTARHATESPGNNRSTPEASRGSARRPAKATGSSTETDGTISPGGPAVASVIGEDEGATKTHKRAGETPLPIKPVSAPGGERKCAGRKAAALPATTIVEKQEEEKWEVDLLICERVSETEAVTQIEQGDTESLPAEEVPVNVALESAAERTATMGQEQSQDHQESQSDPEEPGQSDTMDSGTQSGRRTSPKSPDTGRKPRRVLWRDGGWIGNRMGSPPHGAETVAKAVWYQDEKLDQGADEDLNRLDAKSQSVWFDTADQIKCQQLEQVMKEQKECYLNSAQASGLSSPQLLEQPLSSHQLSSALSQPHVAGTQPALSHGPGAQRREVHGSQQEEEVGPDWKEGGVEGDGAEVSNRETTHSRKSSETADIEDGAEGERQGSVDKGAKGKKKRRKKRGRRGGAEAKLSSSSSIESQSQIEIKTQREQVSDLSTQSEAKDTTGGADIGSPTNDAMHLPSQPEGQTRDAHGPDITSSDRSESTPEFSLTECGGTDLTGVTASHTLETKELSEDDSKNQDSIVTDSDLQMDIREADMEGITTVHLVEKEMPDPTELELKGLAGPVLQIVDNVESKELSVNKDSVVAGNPVPSVDRADLVESKCPQELPVQLSDPTEFTEDSYLAEFPVQNTQHEQSAESNKLGQPVEPTGRSQGLMESARPAEARGLSFEGIADALPLQMWEGSADTTAGGYLEHCLAPWLPRDQQHSEEERSESCVDEEEAAEERSRTVENDSGMVCGEELSSIDPEQDHNKGVVATAVAVVTVAIASAMASIELSQQLVDNQSESQEPLNQTPDDLLNTFQSAQLMDKENCQLLPAETENHPIEQSRIEPTDLFASKEQATVKISEESDSAVWQCNAETEKLSAAQQTSNQQANLDPSPIAETPSLPQLYEEEIQTETTRNEVFTCPLPKEEDSLPHVNAKPLPEADETISTAVDSQGHVRVEIQQQLPSPVADPGQHPETSGTFCTGSEEKPGQGVHRGPQDQSICKEESGMQHRLYGDDSPPLESITTDGEVGRQDSPHSFKAFEDMSDSDRECERDPQPEGWIETPFEGEIPTLALTCGSTLPIAPCDSTAPLNVETGQYQSVADMKLVPAVPLDAGSSTLQSKGQEPDATYNEDGVFEGLEKDSVDTLDWWKERQKSKMKSEAEARKELVTVDVTSQTAEEEERQQRRRDSDGTHNLQIQRERDVFCPEPNTVTTCTDVHPDRGCVSVCLLHRDKDGLKVGAEPDDGVFKRPKDPPSYDGHRDRGVRVSWSSTDDASTQGALSPTEGALSVGTPDPVTPRSSRLSWKSKTEDRGGGGETGGGGEEEEKKDQLPENPVPSAVMRAPICSLSLFRRHSWEPGRNNAAAEINIAQRSSLKSPSGEVKRANSPLHRRSYSLEGLAVERGAVRAQCPSIGSQEEITAGRSSHLDSQERGSLVSLTEEQQEGDGSSMASQTSHQVLSVTNSCPTMFHHQTLTKSISMVTISHRDIDVSGFPQSKRRIRFSLSISPLLPKSRRFFAIGSSSSDEEEEEKGGRTSAFSSNSGSLEYSISEEEPGPLRSDTEAKGGPKISRTFSYIRSKMTKKSKEKEKKGERERESKERDKKSANGHLFIPVSPSPSTACQHCTKLLHNKETFLCNNCGAHVHKCCRENLSICIKSKTKQQSLVPEAVPGSAVNMRSKSTSSASSVSSTSSSSSRERWSTATTPDDQLPVIFPRRHPSLFNPHSNLAKSISTSNIAGLDEVSLKGLKFLSQSTDSLHKGSKVNASTESLTDEGTEMMDSQLMGEFECDTKDLEADSWSGTMDKKFLKTLKKDEIKKQDVIYELYQTEFHHVRTLKIMSEVYYKGLQKELQLDTHTLDKIFPVLDDMLDTHTHFLTLLLERKKASSTEGQNNDSFFIFSIGDVLLNQFSGCSADRMKKAYGKFCSHHNEAVNLYKDLHAKDKRFQAFIKRTMSSSIVRRLSIPECILLVTQRITKYPVLLQRILQHTKDSDEDHGCVCEALRSVKELIMAVDSKVNEQEKKQRLREVYSRTDSKSIMRMKSGQMFAKEDLIRGRRLLHDGALQLKNSAGRLKDVQAMLLSDVLIFLQEKDQKYVFASLDQRSTVISLQNLIVREVANEERGLFLITAGTERPEMVEVLASSKEERNTWRAIIQDAMHCMEKDEDEGVPSEMEEDRRQQENRAKEIRELLRRKDEQIISLLEEKVHIFRDLGDCSPAPDDTNPPVRERMLFMAAPDNVTKGEPIMKDALKEVETLHGLVNSGVGGAGCSVPVGLTGGSVGPVCLPRRAETFGGFDSHQMNSSKNGEKEEGEESLDLRRTESDSVLKKGATASLQMLLKRNNEQVQHSMTHLHDLLITLQAVVVQQDSYVEDQRQTLSDRLTANSSRHSSSSSLSSSSSSRPSSLIEQEKHRSLERQRQEAATLQKQQAAHQEEKRRREKAWELKEKCLAEREERLRVDEEQTRRRRREVTEEWQTLQRRKEEYQVELERLREAQRRLERDKEALRRDTERLEAMKRDESEQLQRYQRTPSTTSEDSIRFHSSGSLDLDSKEAAEQQKVVELSSSAPTKEPFLRIGSKRMGKNFNPFSSSSSKAQGVEKESQLPNRLLQLAKPKEKKDKRKKNDKGEQTQTESKAAVMSDPQDDGDIFFC